MTTPEAPRIGAPAGHLPPGAVDRLLELAARPPDGDGRYRIVREIGRGGMGVVYEAEDSRLLRRVALKVIDPGAGEALRQRFVREATAAARLSHPNIAAVHDATPDYIAMQLVLGHPLSDEPRRNVRRIVALVRDAARAVHAAHEQGVVHRDLKPGNLLVEGERVFVVDFGLAKETAVDTSLSLSGAILGTPSFMAPEQAAGRLRDVDARSDVYGLGASLYAALTGQPPFPDTELVTVLRRIADEEPRAPGIDHDLDLVVLKCLRKERDQRYASARHLADDLQRWLDGAPVVARRPSLLYRASRFVARRRALLRAAAVAIGITALVLVPLWLLEKRERAATAAALELSGRVASALNAAEIRQRIGETRSMNEILETRIADCETFLERYPLPRAWYLLGRLQRAHGRAAAARAAFDAALRLQPDFIEARWQRGLVLTDEEPARARADLEQEPDAQSGISEVDLLFGRAERARLDNRLEEARRILELARKLAPLDVPVRLALCKVALAQGDDRQAMAYSVSAVDIMQGMGPAYQAREQPLGTIDGAPQARRHLVLPRVEGLLVDVSSMLAGFQDNATSFLANGLDALRQAAERAAEGDDAGALASLGWALDRHDAALAIRPILAPAHNNRGVCRLLRAQILFRAGRADESSLARLGAGEDLEHAVEQDPWLAPAWYNRALLALLEARVRSQAGLVGDATEVIRNAEESATQMLRLEEDFVPALALRAQVLEQRAAIAGMRGAESRAAIEAGRALEQALADLDRAVEREPYNPHWHHARGSFKLRRGDKAAAAADLKKALELAPADWTLAAECRARLKEAGE